MSGTQKDHDGSRQRKEHFRRRGQEFSSESGRADVEKVGTVPDVDKVESSIYQHSGMISKLRVLLGRSLSFVTKKYPPIHLCLLLKVGSFLIVRF
jgi:hypothetical protein